MKKMIHILILVTLLLIPSLLSAQVSFQSSNNKVLLLFSYHAGHEWEDSIYRTLIEEMKDQVSGSDLYIEYMDTKRFDPAQRAAGLQEHLKEYPAGWFSLIVAVDDNALQFLSDYGRDLFPSVPIVFCGINGYESMKGALPQEVTGIVSRVNLKDTLLLARKFLPHLKTIHVLSDATSTGEGNRQMIRDQIDLLPPELQDLQFHFVPGEEMSTPEMLDWSAGLSDDSIILLTSWYRDRRGAFIGEKELIASLKAKTSVPVFNLLHIRPGLLGGKVTSGAIQAELAVQLVSRILSGSPASSIPVIEDDTSIYSVDYQRLLYWGFRSSMLPSETHLLNPSLFYQYRIEVILLILVFLILLTLSGALGYTSIQLHKTGNQLIRQKDELFVTLSSIGDGVISTDTETRVVFMNSIAERLTGWTLDEAVGCQLDEIFHIYNVHSGKTVENPVHKVLASGQIETLAKHSVLKSRDNAEYQIDDSASPIREPEGGGLLGAVLVFRDVSELTDTREALKLSREQLRQAARMEAVGKLAGGISHEFNNLLQIIMGYAQLLKEADLDDYAFSLLDPILKTASSARNLTRQLLLFSRKESSDKRNISLSALIQSLQPILDRLLEGDVRLETELEGGGDWVFGDRQQIEQVLFNLCLNARDALSGAGTVKITQSVSRVLSGLQGLECIIPPGDYVHLSVTDNGSGIPHEILPEIFDPFFTTKDYEMGTGLGLSIVYGIIKQHKGYIQIDTDRENGTVFHVYFPQTVSGEEDFSASSATETVPQADGIIFIAEDDPMVRELSEKMIGSLGYRVRSFSDGKELVDFLKIASHKEEKISLFFLDVIMPEMGGVDVYREIRAMGYETPVLFSSGYTKDYLEKLSLLENARLLHKPFTKKEMKSQLNELLSP